MPVLSYNEGCVLDAVRDLTRRDPTASVAPEDVRHRVWNNGYGPNYDQVQRALRGLVEKGSLEKPKRGRYRRRHCPDGEACHRACSTGTCSRIQAAEARRTCKHHHKTRSRRGFSDDSYDQWTEDVLVCADCGEWWRDRPGVNVEES